MHRFCFLLFGLSIVASAGTRAAAQPRQPAATRADSREGKAREMFAMGRYEEALAIYAKLYSETAHPTYLRNIGRCYQNLGQPEKAISSFEEYLRQGRNVSAEQRSQVEGYIREMQGLKAKQTAEAAAAEQAARREAASDAPRPTEQPRTVEPPATIKEQLKEQPAATAATEQPPPTDTGKSNSKRTAAYVVGGAALVALGVGAVFGVRAISKASDVDPHCRDGGCDDTGLMLDREARTAARIADVAIGVGIAAGAVATYLFIASRDHSGSQPAVTVADRGVRLIPEAGPHHGAISLRMRW
jgi:tetratricopeptide (TPR) repeat protein